MNAHRKIIKDNARSLLKIIAKQYNCNYSSALFQILKEHPNAPSFLSLQYILQQMGKESFAMHVTYEELQNLPRPFIAHITTNVDLFLFITNITPDNVQMIDVEGNIETIDRTDFDHMWDGNILLIDEKQGNRMPWRNRRLRNGSRRNPGHRHGGRLRRPDSPIHLQFPER